MDVRLPAPGLRALVALACLLAMPVALVLGPWRAGAPPAAAASLLSQKIKHIVIIMQENRSFDNYFATYPGADGIPMVNGTPTVTCNPDPQTGQCILPYHSSTDLTFDPPHSNGQGIEEIDGGKMDGFVRTAAQYDSGASAVMSYHDGSDLANYWAYARQFVLQDHMFEPALSWSPVAHLYMVSNWSATCSSPNNPMSCSTSLNPDVLFDYYTPPPPNEQIPTYAWTDITYLLHKAGVTWRYYIAPGTAPDCATYRGTCTPPEQTSYTPEMWSPLPYFADVQKDKQIHNVQWLDNFYPAAAGITETLPSVSWIVPSYPLSEHAPDAVQPGQAYVTRLVNAIMQGPFWKSTAIFITWDDWGGLYDHVPPPTPNATETAAGDPGYGLRVPGLVISPYVVPGLIDHQVLSFDAFDKLIEDDFLSGQRIDGTGLDDRPDSRPDVRENQLAGDLVNDFNFEQTPIPPLILSPYPPSPTPTGTATIDPTSTPTETPAPSATLTPTATITPTLSPTPPTPPTTATLAPSPSPSP